MPNRIHINFPNGTQQLSHLAIALTLHGGTHSAIWTCGVRSAVVSIAAPANNKKGAAFAVPSMNSKIENGYPAARVFASS
jgi:hypothetical protein